MKTILIIEDNSDVRENTAEILELANYRVLQAENGNKSRTAEILGIDPSTLYRKLSRYGVEA